jgi:serine/threonine protein phosphatase PrpC
MTTIMDTSSIEVTGLSDPGLVRPKNEDSYLVAKEQYLFIVSDGMGGHQAGEIASQAVIKVLPEMLLENLGEKLSNKKAIKLTIRETILRFSQRLRQESSGRVGYHNMGATLVMAWIQPDQELAHLASIGDSRIYLFRNKELKQLSEDHSITAFLLKHGEITPEEAITHPARHQLTRYIGMENEVYPDYQAIELQVHDRLLLCSDGLTNMLRDDEIQTIFIQNTSTAEVCQKLVADANQAGGKDNITAVVINWNGKKTKGV